MNWTPICKELPTREDWYEYSYNGRVVEYYLLVLRNSIEPDIISARNPNIYDLDTFEYGGCTHWMALPKLPSEV